MKTVIKLIEEGYVNGYWREVNHSYAGETYKSGYSYKHVRYQLLGKRKVFDEMRELRKFYKLKGKVKFKIKKV